MTAEKKRSRTISDEHKAKLLSTVRARQAAGISPRGIGEQKTLKALRWLYFWGWSSAKLLDRVASDNRNGLSSRLERQGLVHKIRTDSGGGQKDIPSYILSLTQLGVAKVEATSTNDEELMPYEVDPHKINQIMLRHDHLTQVATLKALASGAITDYRTPKQMMAKSMPGIKQFDAIFILKAGERMGIEIELSPKWDRKLDQFVLECLLATIDRPQNPRIVDSVAIVSDNSNTLRRYRDAFTPGATLAIWKKDHTRHWQIDRKDKVPEWARDKITFQLAQSL